MRPSLLTALGALFFAALSWGQDPKIQAIINNYSLIPAGFSNSGVSPSMLIAIMGTGLGDPPPASGLALNNTTGAGLPFTSANTSVTITSQGVDYPAPLYYASPGQIAAVVPAKVAGGPAMVVVKHNGQSSAPFMIQVTATAPGLGTFGGIGIATDALTGKLVDYAHAAIPGRIYTFWGSGAGSDLVDGDATYTVSPHAVNQAGAHFFVGLKEAQLLYLGSSGYPGLFQANVLIPADADTGCGVMTYLTVNGVVSNVSALPIDPASICIDPVYGLSGNEIDALSKKATMKSARFSAGIYSLGVLGSLNLADASFASGNGVDFVSRGFPSFGSCQVQETVTGTFPFGTPITVGAVTVTDPANAKTDLPYSNGSYFGQPIFLTLQAGGIFRFDIAGGPEGGIGSISFPVPARLGDVVLPQLPPIILGNVDHTKPIPLSWPGPGSGAYVTVTVSSNLHPSGLATITCSAPPGATGFTIPAELASVLPPGFSAAIAVSVNTLPVRTTLAGFDAAFGSGSQSMVYDVNVK